MTETNLYRRIAKSLDKHGAVIRIENVSGASVPDIAFLTHGTTIWIEAKTQIGHRIHFNKFQFSLAHKALNHLADWQWLCAVQDANHVHIFKFTQLFDRPQTTAKSSKIITVNVDGMEPWCELHELLPVVMTQLHILPAIKAELRADGHGK